MLYLVLALPHLIALTGLMIFAYRTNDSTAEDQRPDDGPRGDGPPPPPEPPAPRPSGGGLPLPHSVPPRRRLQDGERLADLHPAPRRRESEPAQPGAPTVPAR